MKLWFNRLCRDVDSQFRFYASLLGLPEAVASRSSIYGALETTDFQFSFNAHAAYALMNVADPEGHVVRLSAQGLPAEVQAPVLDHVPTAAVTH